AQPSPSRGGVPPDRPYPYFLSGAAGGVWAGAGFGAALLPAGAGAGATGIPPAGAGVGWGVAGALLAGAVPVSCTTEEPLSDPKRTPSQIDVIMKTTAEMVVAFDRKVAAPRAPKAVWLPPPPKAPAMSARLPVWSRTTRIRTSETAMCSTISRKVRMFIGALH